MHFILLLYGLFYIGIKQTFLLRLLWHHIHEVICMANKKIQKQAEVRLYDRSYVSADGKRSA